jgi:hypothetical protein
MSIGAPQFGHGMPRSRPASRLACRCAARLLDQAVGHDLARFRLTARLTEAATARFGMARSNCLIKAVPSSWESMRPIAEAGTSAAVSRSSSWPSAKSAPWSMPTTAARMRAPMSEGESMMVTPKSWRPDGLQYVSQKRDTEVF